MSCEYTAAIRAGFDARQWSGVEVLNWGGAAPVTLPTYAVGEGDFEDSTDFLNGRGSDVAEDLINAIAAGWTGAGAVTMGIDETTGRVFIEADTEDFTITALASNVWLGFDVAGHAAVGGGAPFRRVAPNPWQRASTFDGTLKLDPVGVGIGYTIADARWWQNPIIAMRERGNGDADDQNATNSLEALSQTAAGSTSVHIGTDDAGHVVISWRTGTVAGSPTWSNTAFRDRLGFSGSETLQVSGLVDYYVADYPLIGDQHITEGLDDYARRTRTPGDASQAVGRAMSGFNVGHYPGSVVDFSLLGPAASSRQYHHYLERVLPYIPRGRRCALYPRAQDPRRRLSPFDVTASQPAYDLLYTSGDDGYEGRVRSYVASDSRDAHVEAFRGQTMVRWRTQLVLNDAED